MIFGLVRHGKAGITKSQSFTEGSTSSLLRRDRMVGGSDVWTLLGLTATENHDEQFSLQMFKV